MHFFPPVRDHFFSDEAVIHILNSFLNTFILYRKAQNLKSSESLFSGYRRIIKLRKRMKPSPFTIFFL